MIPGFSWTKVNTYHQSRVTQDDQVVAVAEKKTITTYKIVGEPEVINGKSRITLDTALPKDVTIPPNTILSDDRKTIS